MRRQDNRRRIRDTSNNQIVKGARLKQRTVTVSAVGSVYLKFSWK